MNSLTGEPGDRGAGRIRAVTSPKDPDTPFPRGRVDWTLCFYVSSGAPASIGLALAKVVSPRVGCWSTAHFTCLILPSSLARHHGSDLVGLQRTLWGGVWGLEGPWSLRIYPGGGSRPRVHSPPEDEQNVLGCVEIRGPPRGLQNLQAPFLGDSPLLLEGGRKGLVPLMIVYLLPFFLITIS